MTKHTPADGPPRTADVGRLLTLAREFNETQRGPIPFTKDADADALLNDLKGHPHAFVIACLMDRQVKAETAWLVPHHIRERIGGSFSMLELVRLSEPQIFDLMTRPTPVHRLTKTMASTFYAAVQRIGNQYDGDASRIWAGAPPSAAIVSRFLEFQGAGPKIATMAANILVNQLGVAVSDRYSIDISADTHVRRVFAFLGFVPQDADEALVIYRARELSPEYPGTFDLLLWDTGRTTCHKGNPQCHKCRLHTICPSAT
ncbi:MAG: hypothetical protein A2Y74_02920 [Actinobacteria bacterium RBG_13_63_9]|nr:MAG: hypothetical protein A2Y74_02920 [Actinobacteria bacterium RBG_13_63_9]